MLALVVTRFMHEAPGDVADAATLIAGKDGALDKTARQTHFVDQMMRSNLAARRQLASHIPIRPVEIGLAQSNHAVLWLSKMGPHPIRRSCASYQIVIRCELFNRGR